MQLRILQVVPCLAAGGAETLVVALALELSKLGAEVKLFLTAGVCEERGRYLQEQAKAGGVEIIGAIPHSPASFRNVWALTHIINDWHPHIVHAHLWAEFIGIGGRILSCSPQTRFVRTLHDTKLGRETYKCFWPLRERGFHCTVSCSKAVFESYEKVRSPSMANKSVMVANGCIVAEKNFSLAERQEARKSLGISLDDFVLLHIGAFRGASLQTAQKAHDILLRAFVIEVHHQRKSVLICVGDGPLKESAMALAGSLGISEAVRFLGAVPDPRVATAACDVFVMPSRYEGLPMALIEVASAGVPVITSDIPELSSIRPSEAWKMVPQDDPEALAAAMTEVRLNLSRFHDLGSASAEKIREVFGMRRCAKEYLEVYNNLEEKAVTKSETVRMVAKRLLIPITEIAGRLFPLPESSKR